MLGSLVVGDFPQLAALWDSKTVCLLFGVGVAATLGQFCVTQAFTHGQPVRISVVGLVQFIFALGLDLLITGQIPQAITGKMTALGQTPTEKTPRSFAIDPFGQFLYAAGESSGKLATYQIDTKAGTLKLVKTMDAGKTPWWVLAVEMRKE